MPKVEARKLVVLNAPQVVKQNLFKPSYTASLFVKALSQLNPGQTGKFWAYDGEIIPW